MKKTKEPNFDKMWENILDQIAHPQVYFLEEKETGYWLVAGPQSKSYLTKDPHRAMAFKGKDGPFLAKLFLKLNQDIGTLKNFIVTEHLFL